MVDAFFTKKDLQQIKERGMTPERIIAQIKSFQKGFPCVRLKRPCTAGDGIQMLDSEDIKRLGENFSETTLAGRAMTFVPASGAASRMFKSLLSVNNRYKALERAGLHECSETNDPDLRDCHKFMRNIKSFAFYEDLKSALARDGLDIEKLLETARFKPILEHILSHRGLNLSGMPKGLIKFHRYPGHCRTPLEEHLVEAAAYVSKANGGAKIHFTVSPEHELDIRDHLRKVRSLYERTGTKFHIGISLQEPSTDTIAVDMDNRPFRDNAGNLVFRPGGHGTLIENLNRLKGDIVFLKNIDNIVPDRLRAKTILYKKALGGYLVEIQSALFQYVQRLSTGRVGGHEVDDIFEFAKTRLSLMPPVDLRLSTDKEKARFLLSKLQRPLRICGMVRNEGEPGGGPFWVENEDKTTSLQIVESSQVDMDSEQQRDIWESSTYFNPVDLVCGLRDHLGRPLELTQFRDPDTGFISVKSVEGKDLKALEVPGLWNGAMADWITIFVEVPVATFNPVKTVLDLLREEHRQN